MQKNNQKLAQLVLELFKILDRVEESDSGNEFHPTIISSCRVMEGAKLEELLPEIKRLAQLVKENQ